MDDNAARFAEQLKKNPALLQTLLRSSDGQALLRMLNQNGGNNLRDAVRDASRGKPEEAMRLVNQFMQTPDGAALAARIQKTFGGK